MDEGPKLNVTGHCVPVDRILSIDLLYGLSAQHSHAIVGFLTLKLGALKVCVKQMTHLIARRILCLSVDCLNSD